MFSYELWKKNEVQQPYLHFSYKEAYRHQYDYTLFRLQSIKSEVKKIVLYSHKFSILPEEDWKGYRANNIYTCIFEYNSSL